MKNTKELVNKLSQIRFSLQSLDSCSSQAIIEFGAALEEFIIEIPEMINASSLLELCLEALQIIYQDSTKASQLNKIINTAIVAVEQFIASQENPICLAMLNQAREMLQNSLISIKTTHTDILLPPIISLNDIAILLIQLEPNNEGLASLKNGLTQLLENNSFPISIVNNISQAKQIVEDLIKEKISDKQQALNTIGQLVEKAICLFENINLPLNLIEPSEEENISANSNLFSQVDKLPLDTDISLLKEFIAESYEYIEEAETSILVLESYPNNPEAINTIFRAFHTIKGNSAFLNITNICDLSHKAESLLGKLREGEIYCTNAHINLILRTLDLLKDLLQNVTQLIEGKPITTPSSYELLITLLTNPGLIENPSSTNTIDSQTATKLSSKKEPLINSSENSNLELFLEPNIEHITKTGLSNPREILNSLRNSETFVKVRTDRLDNLINMIGELVISQSMLAEDPIIASGKHYDLTPKIIQIGKIVRELQDLSIAIRMVALKSLFKKMTRLVHDLTHKCNKEVEFIAKGEEIEIDRHMVDLITDPLVHMLRNAFDHGIESAQERINASKPLRGSLCLSAYQGSGSVVIELVDDGRGLNPDKILKTAIAKGIIRSEQLLTRQAIFNLIFAPGFSTTQQVTDLSGRGVGLDVVKRNIESLGGNIDIKSQEGKGTSFLIRLPLTLAITDGMLIAVGKERYILPTNSIYISFRPTKKMLFTVSSHSEMVSLREEIMPIVRLHQLFNIKHAVEDPTQALLIVLSDGNKRYALLVDELLSQQQIVVKSLDRTISKIPAVSAATILGDGCVGLILDSTELISLAKYLTNKVSLENSLHHPSTITSIQRSDFMYQSAINSKPIKESTKTSISTEKFLTFSLAEEEYGIEILKVQEIIPLMPITPIPCVAEFISGLINLRGKIISVINLRLKLGLEYQQHTAETCIVVVKANNIEVGIIVEKVLEVITIKSTEITEVPAFSNSLTTKYFLGVGKIQDQVKLLLDIDYLLSNDELNTIETISISMSDLIKKQQSNELPLVV